MIRVKPKSKPSKSKKTVLTGTVSEGKGVITDVITDHPAFKVRGKKLRKEGMSPKKVLDKTFDDGTKRGDGLVKRMIRKSKDVREGLSHGDTRGVNELRKERKHRSNLKREKLKRRLQDRVLGGNKDLLAMVGTAPRVGSGAVPSILDYGITPQEAIFVANYVKFRDEHRAGRKAKLFEGKTSLKDMDEAIQRVVSNPNVAGAIRAALDDQVHRTLITSDRVLTQVAKIAFADPGDMFNKDGSVKNIHDIPVGLRSCISEMKHSAMYEGRGADRKVVGKLTSIKLSDHLGALKALLKDISDRKNPKGLVNNFYGSVGNLQVNTNIEGVIDDLNDRELRLLVKLAGEDVIDVPGDSGGNSKVGTKGIRSISKIDDLKAIERMGLKEG